MRRSIMQKPYVQKSILQNSSIISFDIKSSCSQRLETDTFALFLEIWNRFINNCSTLYKPGAFITIDKQLFPCKVRCLFTQHMASIPDKFSQKYWLTVGKDNKYIINGFPYVGKEKCALQMIAFLIVL